MTNLFSKFKNFICYFSLKAKCPILLNSRHEILLCQKIVKKCIIKNRNTRNLEMGTNNR